MIIASSGFPYMEFYPKPGSAKIDIDPTRIGLRHPADIGLIGDCRTVLKALLPLLETKSDQSSLQKAQNRMKSWYDLMEERGTRTDMPMKPQVVTHTLNKLLNSDAIVFSDSGTIATWSARYIEMHDTMQFSLSALSRRWLTGSRTVSALPPHIRTDKWFVWSVTADSRC